MSIGEKTQLQLRRRPWNVVKTYVHFEFHDDLTTPIFVHTCLSCFYVHILHSCQMRGAWLRTFNHYSSLMPTPTSAIPPFEGARGRRIGLVTLPYYFHISARICVCLMRLQSALEVQGKAESVVYRWFRVADFDSLSFLYPV